MHETIEHTIDNVNDAFRLLEFSIRVSNYFELDKVDIELFGCDSLIRLERKNVSFNDSYFASKKSALRTAEIAIGASFGVSAIVLDDLCEATCKQRTPKSDAEFFLIWSVVYAVRNTFAHGMANPLWRVYPKYQRKITLHLAAQTTTINLAELNGRQFDYSHIGGFANWFDLKNRALELIQP